MSIVRQVRCDECCVLYAPAPPAPPEATVGTLRLMAACEGWRHDQGRGDRCPACTREPAAAQAHVARLFERLRARPDGVPAWQIRTRMPEALWHLVVEQAVLHARPNPTSIYGDALLTLAPEDEWPPWWRAHFGQSARPLAHAAEMQRRAPTLTEREKAALRLREEERLLFRQIGARLGVSSGRAQQLYHSAAQKRRLGS